MPAMVMKHEVDPKKELLNALGDISSFQLFHNQVLVAIYVRPEKTKSGILLPGQTRDEDKWQGKVGLVVKMGPSAFDDPESKWFKGVKIALHDWIVFRPAEGWQLTVNNVLCRIVDDVNVRGTIPHPDMIW